MNMGNKHHDIIGIALTVLGVLTMVSYVVYITCKATPEILIVWLGVFCLCVGQFFLNRD